MKTIIHSEFLEKQGYWFNIETEIENREFFVVNTHRKRNPWDRDDDHKIIGYFSKELDAKNYFNDLKIGCIKTDS